MALLPSSFLPLPVASLYLIGLILEEVSNRDLYADDDHPALHIGRRPFARRRPERRTTSEGTPQLMAPNGLPRVPRPGTTHSLIVTKVGLVRSREANPRDPFGNEVVVQFHDEHGRFFYKTPGHSIGEDEDGEERYTSSTTTDCLELVLKQPVLGCLSRARVSASLRAPGLKGAVAPMPDDLELSVTPFEESAILRYRQVLAEGLLGAVIVDGKGRGVPIPAPYWREDGASAAFVDTHPTLMTLDGQDVRGHVCVHLDALRAGWRDAFAALPASPLLAEAEFLATAGRVGTAPLLDFALHVARTLGIVDGRGPDGLPIVAGNLEALIEREWKAYGRFDDEPSAYALRYLSTLLRNPDEKSGPKGAWSSLGAA